jgi:hypothetical protein
MSHKKVYIMNEEKASNGSFIVIVNLIYAFCIVSISLFYSACSKNETQTPAPIAALISNLKSQDPDCACNPYMDQYLWNNKTVYVSSCGGPLCDCFTFLYDSAVHQINLDSVTYQQFFQQSTLVKNVWTCK